MTSPYASPLLISPDQQVTTLEKLPLSGSRSDYDEAFIQKLAFFVDTINRFVNAFRHRLERLSQELVRP